MRVLSHLLCLSAQRVLCIVCAAGLTERVLFGIWGVAWLIGLGWALWLYFANEMGTYRGLYCMVQYW